jgi:hypothetical protein
MAWRQHLWIRGSGLTFSDGWRESLNGSQAQRSLLRYPASLQLTRHALDKLQTYGIEEAFIDTSTGAHGL